MPRAETLGCVSPFPALRGDSDGGSLVVIELKTAIVDAGELIGTLDRKRRLEARISESRARAARSVSARRCLLVQLAWSESWPSDYGRAADGKAGETVSAQESRSGAGPTSGR